MSFLHIPMFVSPLLLALAAATLTRIDEEPQQHEEPVTLATPTGTIHGTLLLPDKLPAPVVLLIAGSGPTDRDGNSPAIPGKNNSLKYLAEGLAKQGIATLRYDKRGIAESRAAATTEADLRFTTYVDDATAWLNQLRADKRFTTVTVAGHSEGSLIGMMAAPRAHANGFVSIAGAGRKAGVVLREQLKVGLPPNLYPDAERIIVELEKGQTVDSVAPELRALFRASVQPYIISWINLDPAALVAKLTVPVLLLQGTTDIQISVADAQALAAGNPKAKLVLVDGMNHVLKQAPADRTQNIAAYTNPDLPVVPQVIEEITALVKRAK